MVPAQIHLACDSKTEQVVWELRMSKLQLQLSFLLLCLPPTFPFLSLLFFFLSFYFSVFLLFLRHFFCVILAATWWFKNMADSLATVICGSPTTISFPSVAISQPPSAVHKRTHQFQGCRISPDQGQTWQGKFALAQTAQQTNTSFISFQLATKCPNPALIASSSCI